MDDPTKEIDNLQKEIDQQRVAAKHAQISKPQANLKKSANGSFDAVLVGAGLLIVMTIAVNAATKLRPSQITAISGGSIGAAAGLVVGYLIGRFRP